CPLARLGGMLGSSRHETNLGGRCMDSALFIRWGATAPGREKKSVELFGESLMFLTRMVEDGSVASVEPFFLQPHGGDLEGFFVVRGDRDELHKMRSSDGFQRLQVRAQAVVQNFGVIE